LKRWEN